MVNDGNVEFPARNCLFCESEMQVDPLLRTLVGFELPNKVVVSYGTPLVAYHCFTCGFVATFNAKILGVPVD